MVVHDRHKQAWENGLQRRITREFYRGMRPKAIRAKLNGEKIYLT